MISARQSSQRSRWASTASRPPPPSSRSSQATSVFSSGHGGDDDGTGLLESAVMKERGKFASALLAQLGKVPHGDDEDLEPALADLVERAQRAWPRVRVEPIRFVRYLAERLSPGESLGAALAALHASDLYLACACEGD